MKPTKKHYYLGLFPLAMLITGAIDNIRNLPSTALFGSALVFYFILAAVTFLIPNALISAELAGSKHGSGVYRWSSAALGRPMGFLAIWLQWINTMVWYPTMLSFIAGTAIYFIDPALAQNKLYLIAVILGVFWGLTLLSIRGIHISTRFASFCGLIGMVIPMVFIALCGVFWLLGGHTSQVSLHWSAMLPSLNDSDSWSSLTAITAAFLGIELAAVHTNHLRDPGRDYPKALFISVAIILVTMIFGSLTIAMILPASQINLVDGVVQAFDNFLSVYHIEFLLPVIVIMILLGSLGGMISWIISPAKGLLQAAQDGFLPPWLRKENKHGAPINLLFTQAFLVSFVCLAFLLMPSVNGSYWLLTDLSTQLYLFMYVIMLFSGIKLKWQNNVGSDGFRIMGGRIGTLIVGLLGLIGCAIAIAVGFKPPSGIDVGSFWHYETVFSLGILLFILPISIFYRYAKVTRI
ncbi:MAG: APC family permease [Gammaproteobacteria bacterium]|nr:APC family permease [Gammaproteobacteria bacterium]